MEVSEPGIEGTVELARKGKARGVDEWSFWRKSLLRFMVRNGESVLPTCGSISTVVTAFFTVCTLLTPGRAVAC
jgi:hypothetical protein